MATGSEATPTPYAHFAGFAGPASPAALDRRTVDMSPWTPVAGSWSCGIAAFLRLRSDRVRFARRIVLGHEISGCGRSQATAAPPNGSRKGMATVVNGKPAPTTAS